MPSFPRLILVATLLTVACTAPRGESMAQRAARPVPGLADPIRRGEPDSWVELERVRDAILADLREGEVVRARGRAASVLGVVRVLPSDPRSRILDEIERLDSFAASLIAPPSPGR